MSDDTHILETIDRAAEIGAKAVRRVFAGESPEGLVGAALDAILADSHGRAALLEALDAVPLDEVRSREYIYRRGDEAIARAERAEAENARLRDALQDLAEDYNPNAAWPHPDEHDDIYKYGRACADVGSSRAALYAVVTLHAEDEIARAALDGGGNKDE